MSPSQSVRKLRVLVLEINEISWELMDPWLKTGELKNFQTLRDRGCFATTMTDERPPLLDPWITWTTFYTGVPQPIHRMEFLEQPVESLGAKRLWDLVAAEGKSVGVFGSSGTWPPPQLNGSSFFVPGSFSPDSQTYPDNLRPIQELNLRYTRSHAPGCTSPGTLSMIMSGLRLLKHGLNLMTMWQAFKTLLEIKRHPDRNWKKVCLQPVVNFAFFRKLYRANRPAFSTFHTNHVAHFQHRFFRAWQPERFPDPTDPQEIERFHDAIHYGYLVADRLLGQFFKLCERESDLILCVASSMGQKPWIPERYGSVAPETCRVKSITRLVEILGLKDHCEFYSTMAPQWNIKISNATAREATLQHLNAARYQPLNQSMYASEVIGDTIVITPTSYHGLDSSTTCAFLSLPGSPVYPFDELVIQEDETRKSGCHDPVGMLALYGQPIRSGVDLGELNTLDVTPTLLALMGLTVPAYMKGQDLSETVLTGQVPVRMA